MNIFQHTQRERERHTGRHTQRHTERETHTHRQMDTHRDKHTYRKTHTDRPQNIAGDYEEQSHGLSISEKIAIQ